MKDNNSNNITEKINNQKESLINWEKELKLKLQNKLNNKASEKPKIKGEKIFLVKKDWLEKYKQALFNEPKDYNNLFNLSRNFNLIKNTYFSEIKKIKELPELYPLNQNCWLRFVRDKEKEKELAFEGDCYFKGKFFTKILTLKLKIINNCKTYCFFYLDENNDIKQGYIKINKIEKEDEIMNTLKDGPLKFINNLRINNSNMSEWLKLKYYEIIIFEIIKNKTDDNYTDCNECGKSIILNPQNTKIDNVNIDMKNTMDNNYNIVNPP